MISDKYKCIFVHIPKCGGTSIEDIVWPMPRREGDLWMGFIDKYSNKYQTGGLQHLKAHQIKREVGDERFNTYFKFTFVRNPWDKAVSQFVYLMKRPDLMDYLGIKRGDSFKKYLEHTGKRSHVQWESQVSFIYDDSGDSMVDFIGRFEHFGRDVREVLKRLNIEINEIPHSKKSKRKSYQEYYDDESIKIIEEMYRNDIELLGYRFDSN